MEDIIYGIFESPFGGMILGKSTKGLCWLGFMVQGRRGDGLERMRAYFPQAAFVRDDEALRKLAQQVLEAWAEGSDSKIKLDLRGSPFQKSVWDALCSVEKGQVRTYGEIACALKKPKAARAVGGAVGSNPVSLLVPCHRIIPAGKAGGVGHYGWGSDLKEKMLQMEGAL